MPNTMITIILSVSRIWKARELSWNKKKMHCKSFAVHKNYWIISSAKCRLPVQSETAEDSVHDKSHSRHVAAILEYRDQREKDEEDRYVV